MTCAQCECHFCWQCSRKMSDCKKRLHYKMPHKTSDGETFTINYHFDPSFPEARYEAWEVAREASLQCNSFEHGMKKRLLGVMRKVNCDDQHRLRVRQLCEDALLRFQLIEKAMMLPRFSHAAVDFKELLNKWATLVGEDEKVNSKNWESIVRKVMLASMQINTDLMKLSQCPQFEDENEESGFVGHIHEDDLFIRM